MTIEVQPRKCDDLTDAVDESESVSERTPPDPSDVQAVKFERITVNVADPESVRDIREVERMLDADTRVTSTE